jgi:ABC-type phosphate/phosphonate transport system substrate-binding protein
VEPSDGHWIAGFPMYDFPEIRSANEGLWRWVAAYLATQGIKNLDPDLKRTEDIYALWRDPNLILGQTCGYPLMTELKDSVTYVATPVYTAPLCEGPLHRSVVIARKAENAGSLAAFRGSLCAVNGMDSNSGMNLLRATLAPVAAGGHFFREIKISGSHRESLRMVAVGEADIAAIDCVSFAHFCRFDPDFVASIRVVAETGLTPSLPLITSRRASIETVQVIREALMALGKAEPRPRFLGQLMIAGFEVLPTDAYDAVLGFEAQAVAAGYPVLR